MLDARFGRLVYRMSSVRYTNSDALCFTAVRAGRAGRNGTSADHKAFNSVRGRDLHQLFIGMWWAAGGGGGPAIWPSARPPEVAQHQLLRLRCRAWAALSRRLGLSNRRCSACFAGQVPSGLLRRQ